MIYRRAGYEVKNRQAYRVVGEYGLLHSRRCPAAKLSELLPNGTKRAITDECHVCAYFRLRLMVCGDGGRRLLAVPAGLPFDQQLLCVRSDGRAGYSPRASREALWAVGKATLFW